MGQDIVLDKKLPGFHLNIQLNTEQSRIGILGASGSGKSMFLRCISGIIKPDSGRIAVNGTVYYDSEKRIFLPPRERKVGFLFQNYALFPHMTITQNIAFGLGNQSKEVAQDRVKKLVKKFHLEGLEGRYPSQISGGQQQRVALARAMAVDPDILLLDEPFSALDEHLKASLLKDLSEFLDEYEGTIFFVTHNIQEVYRLADQIAVFQEGNLIASDSKEKLFQAPPNRETARITGYKNIAEVIPADKGQFLVPSWGIELPIPEEGKDPSSLKYVGIRGQYIRLQEGDGKDIGLQVFVADRIEGPFGTSLYLKIGAPPIDRTDYHLHWEVDEDRWQIIHQLTQPFSIFIDPKDFHYMSS
jgi:ABC-type sulfate/molybdate transport systems ATPase subunit